MTTRGTNPRGIELKDELRRRLEVAEAQAAYNAWLLEDAEKRLGRAWMALGGCFLAGFLACLFFGGGA